MRRQTNPVFQVCCLLLFCVMAGTTVPAQRNYESRDELPMNGRADDREARFRWEGVIDGTTLIRINRRQVEYDYPSGLPVQRQRYGFTDPLPFARVEVRLNTVEGRGEIRLIEQPREDNNFTTVVRIEDRDRGTSNYAFELRWEKPRNKGGTWNGEGDTFIWTGRVDGEAIIRVRGTSTRIETISGGGVAEERYRFSTHRGLPDQPLQLSLVESSGRGEIVLLEQPERRNDFTAAVRIRDPQGGTGKYSFTLNWLPSRYQPRPRDRNWGGRGSDPNADSSDQPFGLGLKWTGRVDGRELLRIRLDQLDIEHQNGVPITGLNYRFSKSLPAAARNVSIRKIKGRGKVTLIEQPSRSNNFTATILIDDSDGGSSQYEIEVSW